MNKIKQRKGLVGFVALSALFLYLGGYFLWDGITHSGPGWWRFGGEDYTGAGEDIHDELIPEGQYKRECYLGAAMFFVFAGGFLYEVIMAWRKRNELEQSWERIISNAENVQEIRRNPELCQYDFVQWIKENHPDILRANPPQKVIPPSIQPHKTNLGSVLAKVIAAALLFAALDRHEYDYYTVLRWIVCGVCAFTAVQAIQIGKVGWVWIFGITAIILNPVAPLHLKRETWIFVDLAAGVLLLLAIAVIDRDKPPP